MKKLFILIALFVFAFSVTAQDAYVLKPRTIVGWGTSADTLTASVAETYTIQVKTTTLLTYSVAIKSDSVSGTPAYTALLQTSMDGSNWTNLDTITHTGGADKYGQFAPASSSATNLYYRVIITATAAAQKSNLFIYWAFRKSS